MRKSLYFVSDWPERCYAAVRARDAYTAARIAFDYFREKGWSPSHDQVVVRNMKPPEGGGEGVVLIFAAVAGAYVKRRGGRVRRVKGTEK